MSTVQQKQSTANITTDPLRVFKFQVTFYPPATGGLGAQLGGSSATAGGGIVYGFMTVSGPATNIEVIPYREGGMNTTALPVRSPVLTVNGWKPLEELEIGERVIDPMGEDSKVVDKLPPMEKDTYTVALGDGTEQDACYGHLWTVEVRNKNNRMFPAKTVTVSTEELKWLVDDPGLLVYIPRMQPAHFDGIAELPIDPYLMGILLAEGSLEDETTTFAQDIRNTEVLDRIRAALPAGHTLTTHHVTGNAWKHRISVGNNGPGARNSYGRNQVHDAIRQLGLRGKHAWEKFIPEVYKFASIEDRIDLLRGIMDGDGSIAAREKGVNVRVAFSSERLIRDVRELVMSLGGRCRIQRVTDRTYVYKGERRQCRDTYWIHGMPELDINPFWMESKAGKWYPAKREVRLLRRVTSVEPAGVQLVRCLEVSAASHLFITQGNDETDKGYIIGHNTQKMPGQADFGAITMSHGLKMQASQMDILWMQQLFTVVQGSGTQAPGSEFRMVCDIYVLDHPVTTAAAPVKAAFRLYNTWPSSLAFSDFDAGANAFVIAQMSLAYEGFDVLVASSSGTSEVSFSGG